MRLNKWTISIILVVLSNGCIEPFEPDVEEADEVMVIDGRLSDNEDIQTISISKSSHYNNPQFRPVSGCVVRVEDETGNGITFMENSNGIYQSELEPDFLAVGKAYKLLVVTPEDEVYESEYDSLLACAAIDSLSYRLETQGTSNPDINYYGIRFYLDMKGSAQEARSYMWTFEETWEYLAYYPIEYMWDGYVLQEFFPRLTGFEVCYMTESLKNYEVGSSSSSGSNEIRQQPLHFVSNQTPRLAARYSLLIAQHSLSNGAYLFWDRMKAQTGDTGGLYETQPSRTTGNITNINNPEERVLGYFYVSQVREKRITVRNHFNFPIVRFVCPLLDTLWFLQIYELDPPYPYFLFGIVLDAIPPSPPSPPVLKYVYSFKECHDCTYRGGVTTKPAYWDD
ncbi:MAG: DUF4249 domain-containing protein [Bacteroidota bacterium]